MVELHWGMGSSAGVFLLLIAGEFPGVFALVVGEFPHSAKDLLLFAGGLPKYCNNCITRQSPPPLLLAVISKTHLVVAYLHL